MDLVAPMQKRSPPFTPEQIAYIHSLKAEGLSVYKMSIIMDCSRSKIEWVFLTQDERKAKCKLQTVYHRRKYIIDNRNAESNIRYATDPEFKARRKQVCNDYYYNVIKPARELWRKQNK